MAKKGKKYKQATENIDNAQLYSFDDALDNALKISYANFDETVDVAVKLGVDPRHADQMVRGTVVLPSGTGKEVKVLVFAKGEKEKEAEEAGADYIGSDEIIEKIKGGWLEFDKTVATPDMMGLVGKIGKILGPRGLMPNAKLGTVTFDLSKVIKDIKAGKIDFRVEKNGIIHAPVGKVSFGVEKLKQNIFALIESLIKLKPSSSKGTYIKGITVSTTMGPGLKVDPLEAKAL